MPARRQLPSSCFAALAALLLFALVAPLAGAAPALQLSCFDIIVDGGFEARSGWTLGSEPPQPAYVNFPTAGGSWAMQVGNANQSPSINSYSTFRQRIFVPVQATSAVLSFQVWTQHETNPLADRQEVWWLTPGAAVSTLSTDVIWSVLSSSGVYQPVTLPISPTQFGRNIDLTFAVLNDGSGGRTWMFVDNVSLVVCVPSATPTPSPTATTGPTATPTTVPTAVPTPGTPSPIPPNCMDLLANGDFEWNGAWQLSNTALPPFYAGPPSPVQSGNRSMALGAVLPGAPTNVASFSSIQQAVTLPATAQTAQIRFHYFPSSTATAGGLNRQELVLLDPLNFGETIDVPWRVTENANQWLVKEIDLTRHLGRTLTIYFNARNAGDGARTAMFLDQVQVLACDVVGIMPVYDTTGAYAEAQPDAGGSVLPSGTVPASAQVALVTPAVINAPSVVAVGDNPTPLPDLTPGTAVAPTATPTDRRDQRSGIDLGAIDSPWVVILVISGIVLLAVVLALLFFRGDKEETRS
jgi:hypothetical protein